MVTGITTVTHRITDMAKQRKPFPIVGFFNSDEIMKESSERTINFYVKTNNSGKFPSYLAPWPGHLKEFEFANGNAGRNSLLAQDKTYFVIGDTIYSMDGTFTPTIIANNFFATISGYVGIAAVKNQVLFVDGSKAFLWNIATSTGTDVTAAINAVNMIPYDVTSKDGYFILISNSPLTRYRIQISAINDGTSWSLPNHVEASPNTDGLNAIQAIGSNIFVFGELQTEIWYDSGASAFPLRKNVNVLIGHGVKAQASVVTGIYEKIGQPSIQVGIYLSNNSDGVGAVMMSRNGGRPTPISTPEIDDLLQTFSTPEDAQGFVFKFGDQSFYVLSFTGDNRTFVYQIQLNGWIELETLEMNRYRASFHVYYKGKHIIGDYENANLYILDKAYNKFDTEKIKRTRICRVINSQTLEYVRLDKIKVDCLQGVGRKNTKGLDNYQNPIFPNDASDVNPKLFLSISEDGGITYHDFGPKDIGASGLNLALTEWYSLGRRRDMIAKFVSFNAVPVYILGAAYDFEVGAQ